MLAVNSYWVTWFPGALLATLAIITLAFKGIRTFVRVADAVPTLLDAAAELKNNGGKSVKDDVQHIKRMQVVAADELREQTKVMNDHIAADKVAFKRIEEKLA